MRFRIRLPISNNHSHKLIRIGRRNVRVLSEKGKAWMDECVYVVKKAIREQHWQKATGKVVVNIWFYYKDHRIRDSHNGLKLLLDAMEDAGVYSNDYFALPRIMDFEVDSTIDEHFIVVELERYVKK